MTIIMLVAKANIAKKMAEDILENVFPPIKKDTQEDNEENKVYDVKMLTDMPGAEGETVTVTTNIPWFSIDTNL